VPTIVPQCGLVLLVPNLPPDVKEGRDKIPFSFNLIAGSFSDTSYGKGAKSLSSFLNIFSNGREKSKMRPKNPELIT